MNGIVFACFLMGGFGLPMVLGNSYCSPSYCPDGETNIGCKPPPLPGASTCISPVVVEMTAARKALILDLHNSRRAALARGELAGFPSAACMASLQWDDELAAQAGHNARSCEFKHDECRNTNEFRWAGQNLAIIRYHPRLTFAVERHLNSFAKMWWDENEVTTQQQINSYPDNYTGPDIGHFTQMASERAAKIGCAMQNYLRDGNTVYYLVCNYSYTNIIDRPVYTAGPSASGCTTGQNPSYPGLCSINEVVPSAPQAPS